MSNEKNERARLKAWHNSKAASSKNDERLRLKGCNNGKAKDLNTGAKQLH
jgi:hypothetical protein